GLTWLAFAALIATPLLAQPQPEQKNNPDKEVGKKDKKDFIFGPGPGFGGPFGQTRKLVKDFDKNGDGWLNNEERKAAREFLKKGPGGKGFGAGGKGFKGRFSPFDFVAKPLIEAVDTDKDSKISKAELLAGVKKFYAECDKEKKGTVDESALAEALNRLLPRPNTIMAPPPGGGFQVPPPPIAGGLPNPGAPPGAGGLLPPFFERLNLSADQKKQVDELLKEFGKEKQNEELRKKVDSGLAKILNDEQKKTLQEMRERMGRGPG